MKYVILKSLFCCSLVGSIYAGDLVPLAQDVAKDLAKGLAQGAAWTAGGAAAGVIVLNLRILYFDRYIVNPTMTQMSIHRADSDAYAMACLRAGAGAGVLHGLKNIGIEGSYVKGVAMIGGSVIALKQIHGIVRPEVPATWYNVLVGWVNWPFRNVI